MENKELNNIEVTSEIVSPSDINLNFMQHTAPTLIFFESNGESTRIVDRCIQEFFANGKTYVYRGRGKRFQALHEKVFEIFDLRMKAEHPNDGYKAEFKEIDAIWCWEIIKN